MNKNSVGDNEQDEPAYHLESGECKPENGQQSQVFLQSTTPRIAGDHTGDFFAAAVAEFLVNLKRRATLIAEHEFLHLVWKKIRRTSSARSPCKRKGHLARAASSLRENSSNGGFNAVKTFWRNLMSRKLGCQETFWEINPYFSVT